MPQLERNLFEGQLPRRDIPRAPGSTPLRSVATGGVAEGAALGNVGQAIQQLGQALSAIDERFATAKANIMSAEALGDVATRMQVRAQELRADQTIFPTDRAGIFQTEFQPELDRVQATVPERGQAGFRRQATNVFLRFQRELADQGRKDSLSRAEAAYNEITQRTLRALIPLQSEAEEAELLRGFAEVTQAYIANGLLSQDEAQQRVRNLRQDVAVNRAELAIAQAPELALVTLRQGLEANPDIPPEKLPELIERAQSAVEEGLVRHERREGIAERELAFEQDTLASVYRSQVSAPDVTVPALHTLLREVNQDRADGRLSEGDHAELTRTIPAMIDAELSGSSEGMQASDREIGTRLTIAMETAETREALDAAREQVLADASMLHKSTVSALLNSYNERLNATFFANRPAYRQGVRVIQESAGIIGLQGRIMERVDPAVEAKLAASLRLFREAMRKLSADDVDAQAIPAANAIREQYFPSGETVPEAAKALPPILQELSFEDAVAVMREQNLPLGVQAELIELLERLDARGLLPE